MKKINYLVTTLFLLSIASCSSSDDKDNIPEVPPVDENIESMVPNANEKTIYGTWVNVWIARGESWWRETDYRGQQTFFDNNWKSVDWRNKSYRINSYKNIKDAGIDFLITDNTNYKIEKTDSIIKDFKEKDYGLKFSVALGHAQFSKEKIVNWLLKISTDPNYMKVDDMPLLICYVGKDQWDKVYKDAANLPTLQKFYRVWASGEITFKDKFGWQLEPEDGVAESKLASFVTPSIKHESTDPNGTDWSKSIAMLDYSFAQARKNASRFIVAGSYDDVSERNGWLPLKTEGALPEHPKYIPIEGVQMFDPWTGKIADPYVFYNRMKSWLKGEKLHVVPKGIIADGIYRIKTNLNDFIQTVPDYNSTKIRCGKATEKTYDKFVFYHLGNNKYRIINVYTGKPLKVTSNSLMTSNWSTSDDEIFIISDNENENDGWNLLPIATFNQDQQVKKCHILTVTGIEIKENV